jgi:hypothetical protein
MLNRLLILLCLLPAYLKGQDYRCVIPQQEHYFQQQGFILNSSYFGYNSEIKIAYFDSVVINGSTTELFSFYTLRDSDHIQPGPGSCMLLDGPSWLGWKVKEEPGQTTFYNMLMESIVVRNSDAIGDSSVAYAFQGGNKLWLRIDSIIYLQMGGIPDSVKCFTFFATDSLDNAISSSLNGKQLLISKSNGFFSAYNFYDFPRDNKVLLRTANFALPTAGDIYNFDVGDEFEYQYHDQYWIYAMVRETIWIRITGKAYTASMDSVIYYRSIDSKKIKLLVPVHDTTYNSYADTLVVGNINQPFYPGYPEQNNFDSMLTPLNYYIENDSSLQPGNYIYSRYRVPWIADTATDCLTYDIMNSSGWQWQHVPGLGIFRNKSSFSNGYIDTQLIWYKKGSTTWGTFVPVGIEESHAKNSISIFPNPVQSSFSILNAGTGRGNISIVDVSGRTVKTFIITDLNSYSVTELPQGVYIVHVQMEGSVFTTKLIMQ